METVKNYLTKESLEEVLVRTGMIAEGQMQDVLQIANKEGKTIEQVLVEEGLLSTRDLSAALSIQLKVSLIDLKKHSISPEILRLVPEELARKFNVIPLDVIGRSLVLVMEAPMNVEAIDTIAAVSKMPVEPMMGFRDEIRETIDRIYVTKYEPGEEFVVTTPPLEEATSMAHSQSPESKSDSAYIKVEKLLKLMVDKHASDLHLKVSSPPVLRIDGVLVPQDDLPPLTAPDIESAFKQVTTEDQRIAFARERYLDLAYSVHGLARFRLNILQQRGTLSLAFRLIPFKIPSIDELELPQICKELVMKPRGLILVTGPAGSGKSTTLAAMISHLNENEKRNVISIEDPIEFLYPDKKCLIAQLELGDDTKSFAAALKHALRHDPNVIVIGEMRDLDTISTAITAAETGHLILGTLHTIDAVQSVDRLVDMFPNGQQQQVRLQLAQVIEAVLSQRLVTRSGGGQIAAFEIMIANSVIRRLIREDQAFEIPANIEMSIREGMQTLDQALADLVRRNIVTIEEAMMKSSDPGRLSKLLQH